MKEDLLKYLKSKNMMSIATHSDLPWNSIAYYGIDDDFNLYFISKPETRHCKNIELNNKIACTIADSNQQVTSKKIGAQIQGECQMVENEEEVIKALELWSKANPGVEGFLNLENMKNGTIASKMYKIKPTYIKFLNEELFGQEGVREINF